MDFRTKIIDFLRHGKDKAALGPMQYDISGGTAVPVNPNRPQGAGARRDRKIEQALRDAGV